LGLSFNYGQMNVTGTSTPNPDAGTWPDGTPVPNALNWADSATGAYGAGSVSLTQAGSTLTMNFQLDAGSTLANYSGGINGVLDGYQICFDAPGAASVDFVYTCSGTVAVTGGTGSVTGGVFDGSNDVCASGNLVNDSGLTLVAPGWDHTTFTDSAVNVANSQWCDGQNYTFQLKGAGGETTGLGATGTVSGNITISITAAPH
jgi:hypothetical protein